MPTISTADFKNGLGLRIKDKVYTIVEFQHVNCLLYTSPSPRDS